MRSSSWQAVTGRIAEAYEVTVCRYRRTRSRIARDRTEAGFGRDKRRARPDGSEHPLAAAMMTAGDAKKLVSRDHQRGTATDFLVVCGRGRSGVGVTRESRCGAAGRRGEKREDVSLLRSKDDFAENTLSRWRAPRAHESNGNCPVCARASACMPSDCWMTGAVMLASGRWVATVDDSYSLRGKPMFGYSSSYMPTVAATPWTVVSKLLSAYQVVYS